MSLCLLVVSALTTNSVVSPLLSETADVEINCSVVGDVVHKLFFVVRFVGFALVTGFVGLTFLVGLVNFVGFTFLVGFVGFVGLTLRVGFDFVIFVGFVLFVYVIGVDASVDDGVSGLTELDLTAGVLDVDANVDDIGVVWRVVVTTAFDVVDVDDISVVGAAVDIFFEEAITVDGDGMLEVAAAVEVVVESVVKVDLLVDGRVVVNTCVVIVDLVVGMVGDFVVVSIVVVAKRIEVLFVLNNIT